MWDTRSCPFRAYRGAASFQAQIMYQYTAYGLHLVSNLSLPEMNPVEGSGVDVTIAVKRVARLPAPLPRLDDDPRLSMRERYVYSTEDLRFTVAGGREIIIEALPHIDERVIQQALLGPVLGVLLFQRGHLVLHASAVVVNEKAVVFVGEKGQGKSTTAAAFFARGHKILADDVVVLDFDQGPRPLIFPGVPQLRLWPDSVTASLGDDPASLPEIVTGLEKRFRCTKERFATRAYPVERVCVLQSGEHIGMRLLSLQEALLQSVRHTFVRNLLDRTTMGPHLQQCAQLVRTTPIFALERPREFDCLPAVVKLVESCVPESLVRV